MLFFTKLWFFLVALLAAAAAALLLVIPRPAMRDISRAQAEGLDRIQHNTDLLLRLRARHWTDAAARIARDGELVEALERVNDRRSAPAQVSASVGGRLLALTAGLGQALQPKLMAVTDADGKQITRLGPGSERVKPGEHGIGGYPAVEAALRGYRADDAWSVDGKLYIVATSPIISPVRRRYVGALVLGQELDSAFAEQLKRELGGTDLVFFLRGSAVATTIPANDPRAAQLNALPRLYADRRAQIRADGRSMSMPVGSGAGTLIMAPLTGEAGAHDAFYAVVSTSAPPPGLVGLVKHIEGKDLAWGRFPWLLLGGGLLTILIIGLAVMFWEVDAPARRLLARFTALGKGELARIEDRGFSGKYGSMARSVNAALDRAEKRGQSAGGGAKNLSTILGSPGEPAAQPDLRVDPSFSTMPPLAPASAGPLDDSVLDDSDLLEVQGDAPVLEVQATLSPMASMGGRELDFADQGRDLEDAPTELQQEPLFSSLPAAPGAGEISLADIERPGDEASSGPELALPSLASSAEPAPVAEEGAGGRLGLQPPVAAYTPLPPLEEDSLPMPKEREAEPSKPELELEAPAASEAEEDPQETELKEYFEQVYHSFIAVKRQCGENVDNLTLERFAGKLRQNRASLIARYECKAVNFQVYIKDGKAAIKATPVKD